MKHSTARAIAAAVVTAGLALGGCAQIPTEGRVTSQDISVPDLAPIYLTASGPTHDATAQEIVEGFISAQAAGLADDWLVAREFLTETAASKWQPMGQTTVFSGELHLFDVLPEDVAAEPEDSGSTDNPTNDGADDQGVSNDGDGGGAAGGEGATDSDADTEGAGGQTAGSEGASAESTANQSAADSDADTDAPKQEDQGSDAQDGDSRNGESDQTGSLADPNKAWVAGSVSVAATLDRTGIYTEALPDAQSKLNFELVRDSAGQWRIDTVADGYYISEPNFQSQFRPVSVYFISADQQYLVPEIRWFWRNRIETYAINSLLAGPSPWLQDAVSSAIPAGTRLVYDSVSVDGIGAAHINLSAEVLNASAQERKNLTSQINATLLRLPGVRTVEIQVSSVEFQQEANDELRRDPILASAPIVLSDDRIMRLSGRSAEPVDSFGSLEDLDVTALSLGEDQSYGVMRLGTDTLAKIPAPGQGLDVLMQGEDLLAPSIDRFGWVWSGESEPASELRAVQADGTEVTIAASWLAERTVIDIKVAHDGTRVAIISADSDQTQIEVAAIIRDSSFVPVSLSTPVTVGSALRDATLMRWLDETTLAVVAHSATGDLDTLFTVAVGGRSEMISNVDGAVSMGAGRGLRSLFIGTDTGEVLSRTSTGASWSVVLEGAFFPTFPG